MIEDAMKREHPARKYASASDTVACNNKKCAQEPALKYFAATVGAHECRGETRRDVAYSMNPKHTLLRDVALRRT